ncbi:hypothetical protein HPB52_015163 [Rhipicephalus sanguineus]|uniref:Uncharacterized protein n=1 Tax=Rhipicephalus sanguineus TaxID=34632 RepID=A0A9D4SYL0_RHISA|nr:hypothetical protein HPB52_015163 [Rhipicephalus sanguineus]
MRRRNSLSCCSRNPSRSIVRLDRVELLASARPPVDPLVTLTGISADAVVEHRAVLPRGQRHAQPSDGVLPSVTVLLTINSFTDWAASIRAKLISAMSIAVIPAPPVAKGVVADNCVLFAE